MTIKSLKWKQVNAWRLSQQSLSPRLKHKDFLKAVRRMVGIQAQVMSAAELAIGARVDGISPLDIKGALWQNHTLVKTWAMRGTLYLLTADELPLYVAARGETGNWMPQNYFAYYGIPPAEAEAFLEAVPEILGGEPMTREQLATTVAQQIGSPALRDMVVTKGWGTPLKPSAWRGDLCFGPSQGPNVTFVNPRKWIGDWQSPEPYVALQEIARRYLRAYGPATPKDFALWWGVQVVPARKLFQSIADELEEVSVEGWRSFALKSTLKTVQELEAPKTVRLLPLFDGYTFSIRRDVESLLPKAYKSRVFRPQGWISAVVLMDGAIKGIWEYKTRGSQTILKINMFSSLTTSVRRGIEAEVARLGDFLNTSVEVMFDMH